MNKLVDLMNGFRHLSWLRYGKRLRATRDWLAILGTSLALLVASFAWNAWVFIEVGRGEILGPGAAPAPLDAPLLEEVHALFAERAAEAARYESEYRFIDPSR